MKSLTRNQNPPAKRDRGRPRLLHIDPGLTSRVAGLVRSGAHPAQAAQSLGVASASHHRWVAAGLEERSRRESGEPPRASWDTWLGYVEALERADAEAEILLLARVLAAEAGSAQAFTLLERRFPWWSQRPTTPAGPFGRRQEASAAPTPLQHLESRRRDR